MTISSESDGAVPLNYREVLNWKISQMVWRAIAINLAALPLAAIFAFLSLAVVFLVGRPQEIESVISSLDVIVLVAGVVLTIPLHELTHGIAMQAYGARAQYGFTWKALAFYATSPGYAFRRNHYLLILLAPLVGLSILFYLGILLLSGTPLVWLLAACAFVNGGSACGDLWMSVIILRYPQSAYIIDERDGLRVFMPPQEPA